VWNGPLALAAAHPWLLGTPRTGAFMALGVGAFGFALWAGSAVLPLAAPGLRREGAGEDAAFRRTAIALVAGYLVVVATPLHTVLYARYAGLAVFGLLLLAGRGVRAMASQPSHAWALAVAAAAVVTLLAGDVIGRALYPLVRERYAEKLRERLAADGYGGRSQRLRDAQVAAVPAELSLANPEVAAGALAVAALALLLLTRLRSQPAAWAALLVFNLASPVLHARRFLPRCDAAQWARLLAGSPAQRGLVERLAVSHGRIEETIATTDVPRQPGDGYAALFPQEMGGLHRLHTAHGYAALVPATAAWSAASPRPNAELILRAGNPVPEAGTPRFHFAGDPQAATVEAETLNSITVRLPHARGGTLLRMDTPFPGWRVTDADSHAELGAHVAAGATEVLVPPGASRVRFDYRPRRSGAALSLAALGAAAIAAVSFRTKRRDRNLMTA
jgi:hypothetical protein